jgi:hypothetical protein
MQMKMEFGGGAVADNGVNRELSALNWQKIMGLYFRYAGRGHSQ